MNIQYEQLVIIVIYLVLFTLIYKLKSFKQKSVPLALVLIMFISNPFRMVTDNRTFETTIKDFSDIPEKIVVKTQSFDDFNKSEILKLNKLFEETKNEIHD